MRRLLLPLFVLLIIVTQNLSAQSSTSPTEVVIIGTMHSANAMYNGDSLLTVITGLKPDVILIEQDSTSYTFGKGSYRRVPKWSMALRKTWLMPALQPEADALQRYQPQHPNVIIKPHDVAFNGEGRVQHRKEIIKLGDEFAKAMSRAYDNKEMSEYRSKIHLERRAYIAFIQELLSGSLQGWNTDSTTVRIRNGEALEQAHFRALIDSVSSLQLFAARVNQNLRDSRLRDEAMVKQIIRYIQAYPGKRILVMAGALHRYYQLDALAPKQQELNFKLLDLYGNEWKESFVSQHQVNTQ